jgi:hypothetical protein
MDEAFAHHVWATLRVSDVCAGLSPAQLETAPEGIYGSILATLRHLVGADSWYLFDLTGDPVRQIQEESMDIPSSRHPIHGHAGLRNECRDRRDRRCGGVGNRRRHPASALSRSEVSPTEGAETDRDQRRGERGEHQFGDQVEARHR